MDTNIAEPVSVTRIIMKGNKFQTQHLSTNGLVVAGLITSRTGVPEVGIQAFFY